MLEDVPFVAASSASRVRVIPPELREAHVAGFTRRPTTSEAHAVVVPSGSWSSCADGTRVECASLMEQIPAVTGEAVYVACVNPGSTS